jgi:hypothetical protein
VSYDLRLFEIRERVDAGSAYEQLMRQEEAELAGVGDEWLKRSLPASTRTRMQQLADALRARWVRFVQFEPKSPLPWIELNDENLQVQVSVYENSVSITIPYFREQVVEMMACLSSCIQVCHELRGYTAFDPQLGRAVTADDSESITRAYRSMNRTFPDPARETKSKNSWWNRLWSR